MSGPSAREVALAAVMRVTDHGGYSNLVMRAALDRSGLTGADRRLVAELAYGTLRRLRSLDWALARHVDRPLHRVDPRALAALRVGAYQLLFTRIPPHAAVSETVGVAGGRERGFVNAVLRALASAEVTWPPGPADEEVSVRTGMSAWAVGELRALLGSEVEEAASALAARASVALRTNTCRTSAGALESALTEAGTSPRRGSVHPETFLVDTVSPRDLPGFDEGWFSVQDEASAYVVASGLGPGRGERVLDVCAGPGGKAGHIACLVAPGGTAVAADVSAKRARLVVAEARRLGVSLQALAQDACRPALRGAFDRVLVDAPCSGIGSARRRPELLWRPEASQLRRLSRLQAAIAASAAELVRPGGRLVYSVCTFPGSETDDVCERLERERPDLRPEDIEGPDGPSARVRLWPHLHQTDAMFVAAYRRS